MGNGESHCGFSCTYEKRNFYQILEKLWDFAQYDPNTALEIAEEFAFLSEKLRRAILSNSG